SRHQSPLNCQPEFTAQAKVVNGASDLLGQLFAGGHARSAVGVTALPLGAAVELEMVVELGDA
ncbi:MAG: RidA family protein, partial [Firmicutes bacterium]|nr:RidA family protein [Bacillota bacterium]